MDPVMAAEVDPLHRGPGDSPHRLFEVRPGAGQGQDRSMVVGISVHVEQGV